MLCTKNWFMLFVLRGSLGVAFNDKHRSDGSRDVQNKPNLPNWAKRKSNHKSVPGVKDLFRSRTKQYAHTHPNEKNANKCTEKDKPKMCAWKKNIITTKKNHTC